MFFETLMPKNFTSNFRMYIIKNDFNEQINNNYEMIPILTDIVNKSNYEMEFSYLK